MPLEDVPTFYLYGIGHHPDLLSFGHLVYKDYANPLIAAHSRIPKLSDRSEQELLKWTKSTEISGAFGSKGARKLGFKLQVAPIGEAGLSLEGSESRLIVAKAGRRMVLEDSNAFFEKMVISQPDTRNRLLVWLTTAASAYVIKKVALRTPKVWMLTGLYELEQVQAFNVKSSSPGVELGLDPAVLAALAAVPIGGSVSFGNEHTAIQTSSLPGANVWAAQWQRLKVDYVKLRKDESPALPLQLVLLPDVSMPSRAVLSDSESELQGVELIIEDAQGGEDEISDDDQTYQSAFKKAEERIARRVS
ncbi:hypothetical protein LTR97_007249 [Elasticomyces elasticus]|uniref:Uncharacterized protein n=1 Tax=Elasticomyces elasticus TaxID=574655 RepID=A0AAN7W4E8_9PEZI|nr:hypothetical protein LTR97_007249 [Elasticomyces elasticus]